MLKDFYFTTEIFINFLQQNLTMVFDKIKRSLSGLTGGSDDSEYIEIDLGREVKRAKVVVRPFVLKSFEIFGLLGCKI